MIKNKEWRLTAAVVLTSIGVLYYLIFLLYFAGGQPIERIHNRMTDGWPDILADNVPFVAPIFLFLGLWLGYLHNEEKKPKREPEPIYDFKINYVKTPGNFPTKKIIPQNDFFKS